MNWNYSKNEVTARNGCCQRRINEVGKWGRILCWYRWLCITLNCRVKEDRVRGSAARQEFIRSQKGVNAFNRTSQRHTSPHLNPFASESYQIHPFITIIHHISSSSQSISLSQSHISPSYQINFQFQSPINKSQKWSNQQLNPELMQNLILKVISTPHLFYQSHL